MVLRFESVSSGPAEPLCTGKGGERGSPLDQGSGSPRARIRFSHGPSSSPPLCFLPNLRPQTARHAAEDLTALVLATPPSRDRTAGHFASLQMYLLFAPPSDTSAPVHAIIYRETHHSFPFDVGIVERFFLPRCHEDAKMLGSAICNAILDVEESAPLGIPDLETWEKEPKLQVGEIVTRGAVAYVVCRCWQQEEENCEFARSREVWGGTDRVSRRFLRRRQVGWIGGRGRRDPDLVPPRSSLRPSLAQRTLTPFFPPRSSPHPAKRLK